MRQCNDKTLEILERLKTIKKIYDNSEQEEKALIEKELTGIRSQVLAELAEESC